MRNKEEFTQKKRIFYAREYRHFQIATRSSVLYLLLCVLPLVLLVVLFYDPITLKICNWTGKILSGATGQEYEILEASFLPKLGNVHYVSIAGSLPSFSQALITGILTLAAIIICSQISHNVRSLMIYICMGLYVLLASCVFFVFWPDQFPYQLADYSELYMVQQVALWIIIPSLFGLAVSLVQTGAWPRILSLVCMALYSGLYGIVRYAVYLSMLIAFTSLYMATLFFTFGVLFDFIQMVAVYAIFAKNVSERYNSVRGKAKWLWS